MRGQMYEPVWLAAWTGWVRYNRNSGDGYALILIRSP